MCIDADVWVEMYVHAYENQRTTLGVFFFNFVGFVVVSPPPHTHTLTWFLWVTVLAVLELAL